MENIQEDQDFKTNTIAETTTNPTHKSKWALIGISCALIVSVIINALLILGFDKNKPINNKLQETVELDTNTTQDQTTAEQPSDDTSALQETHRIGKQVTYGDVKWIGIQTTPSFEWNTAQYELWRIDGQNNKTMVDSFNVSGCNDLSWDLNDSGGINLTHTASPCEAYVITTNILYDKSGTEQFRTESNSSANDFIFKQLHKPEYTVTLLTEGACEGNFDSDQDPIPSAVLKGVSVASPDNTKEFLLSKTETVSCDTGYGNVFLSPIIGSPRFDNDKIEFQLPNKHKAIISLDSGSYAEVTFE